MNVFGLFFSFFMPGLIIGLMAGVALKKKSPCSAGTPARDKRNLYMHSISENDEVRK